MSRGRGRGKTFGGPRSLLPGDLSLGSLTYSDVLSTAQSLRSRSGGAKDLWDYNVETPDTKTPDSDERREARWGTRVAMGNGMGGLEVKGGKFWVAVGSSGKGAKGKAKQEEGAEPWLYSERYKKASTSTDPSSASTKRLPLLAPSDKALLDPAFFPPELWSSYYNPKPVSPRKRKSVIMNGAAKKKAKVGVEGLVGQFEDAEGEEGAEKEEEEAEQQDDDEEGEEEDQDYDNNYFDNGEDDEGGGSGGEGDDGGVFD